MMNDLIVVVLLFGLSVGAFFTYKHLNKEPFQTKTTDYLHDMGLGNHLIRVTEHEDKTWAGYYKDGELQVGVWREHE